MGLGQPRVAGAADLRKAGCAACVQRASSGRAAGEQAAREGVRWALLRAPRLGERLRAEVR